MGDVRAGKTRLTARLLEEAVALGLSGEITVVDMAPETRVVEGRTIGGRISEMAAAPLDVRYLTPPRVETPRLTATSPEELLHLARLNVERISPLLEAYTATPTPILFINDISIYLQAGSVEPLLHAAGRADTFIANGYYGGFLSRDLGTGISRRERE
ncbi:MAG: hypothetical protein ACE5OO_07720, partial [Candidatus Bathyarchaeia archaeon]